MIIAIGDNLIVNINRIDYIYNNQLVMINGDKFRLDEITVRNVKRVADANAAILFNGMVAKNECD